MYHRVIDVISLRKRREVLKEKQEKLKSFRCSDSSVMFFCHLFFCFFSFFLLRFLFFIRLLLFLCATWSFRAFAKEKCSSLDVKKVLLILCQLVPFKLNRLHRLLRCSGPAPRLHARAASRQS